MVEKKLNFNQPILSVRRYSPKMVDQMKGSNPLPRLPPHRPESSNSGPVRNPGSVPFMWEQSPGRPKEEILPQPHQMEGLQETSANFDCNNALIGQEEEEETRQVVNQDKAVVVHCRPSFDGGDGHENVITVCCLLPRSFLKSSVCNLNNPVAAMSRVMTFPASRRIMVSESESPDSSTDCSENEYAVKRVDGVEASELKETRRKKSFKTLQELLADDEREVEGEDDERGSGEMKVIGEDSSSEDEIRLAVNKAAEDARKRLQLSRAASPGSVAPPPPLPESPSDSWLFRTLSSKKKVTFASRFSNKY